jgi:hypothetical protein
MKPKKINTELNFSDDVGEWNGRDDKWSRNAKHRFGHSDFKNAKILTENQDLNTNGASEGKIRDDLQT